MSNSANHQANSVEANLPPAEMKLHIHRYDFTIPRRYAPGHQLTEGEAKALNQLMMENIRNNVAPWIRAAEAAAPQGVLALATHEALQVRIYSYAVNYQFMARSRQRPVSAIDAAIDELASAQAELEGNQRGLPPDSEEVQQRFQELQNSPAIRSRARMVVSERARLANTTLTEILGVED